MNSIHQIKIPQETKTSSLNDAKMKRRCLKAPRVQLNLSKWRQDNMNTNV